MKSIFLRPTIADWHLFLRKEKKKKKKNKVIPSMGEIHFVKLIFIKIKIFPRSEFRSRHESQCNNNMTNNFTSSVMLFQPLTYFVRLTCCTRIWHRAKEYTMADTCQFSRLLDNRVDTTSSRKYHNVINFDLKLLLLLTLS